MKATQHWTIVFNPTSGTYKPDTLDRIQRTLRDVGVRSVAIGTDYAGHGSELCHSITNTDRVACYSGDGTLNEVAAGLLGRNLPLAFLPGGTANVMAHELGLPRDPIKAALILLKGRPRPIRPGTIGPGIFLLMAGIGFDAKAVSLVSPRFKAYAGRGAYVWAGLRAFFAREPELRINGGQAPSGTARWVVAARAGCYGGPFTIHPHAGLESPLLGVAAVGPGRVLPFLVSNLGFGESRSRPGRALMQANRIVIESDQPAHLQVDGDYWGQASRFEIGMANEPLPMCFPEPA
jgi:diacylglycerol kinase (ATP)